MQPRLALDIHVASVGYRTVLSLDGEVDPATVGGLRDALGRTCEREVWIDLTRVRFMDSSGLHALADAHAAFERDGRTLAIICPPGNVRRVFTVAGLDGVLRVFPDQATAHFGA